MNDDLYYEKLDEMDKMVSSRLCDTEIRVRYSAYDVVDDLPVNNLNEIPYDEDYKVIVNVGGEEVYVSNILSSPTWLDLCVVANEGLLFCDAGDHVFLESLYKEENYDDVKIYRMYFGS